MRKTTIATIVIPILASQVFGQEAEHKAAAVASVAFKAAKSKTILPADAPSIKQTVQSESVLPADAPSIKQAAQSEPVLPADAAPSPEKQHKNPPPESDSQWKVEFTKDAMTDKGSTTASLTTSGAQLVVGSGVIVLYVESWPHQGRTNVQWRIDDDRMVDEYWFASKRIVGTPDTKKLLRAMVNGNRLRIRIVDDSTTFDFNVAGFAGVLPKLGMKM
jgi:hypothetical protein